MDDETLHIRFGEGAQLPQWFWRALLAIMLAIAGLGIGRTIVEKLGGLLVIIAISLFLSFAVEPAVNWLADRGWKRNRATMVAFLVLFVGSSLFFFLMGDLVVTQVSDLVDKAPKYLEDATKWVNDTFDTDITTDNLVDQVRELPGRHHRRSRRTSADGCCRSPGRWSGRCSRGSRCCCSRTT